jgi:hypothetical protein
MWMFHRLNTRYQAQAASLFGGAGVISATSDATSSSGAFISVGSKLFRVTLLGDISVVGGVQDVSSSFGNLVPSAMVFQSRSLICAGISESASQGEDSESGCVTASVTGPWLSEPVDWLGLLIIFSLSHANLQGLSPLVR